MITDTPQFQNLLEAHAALQKRVLELETENAELREASDVTDKILAERQRVLEAIPQCEEHGFCVPHALEWVSDRLNEKAV